MLISRLSTRRQAARDAWLLYADGATLGTRTFPNFLRQTLEAAGVKSLTGVKGAQKTAAEKANVSYILDFRADMRGRLVQAALASKLAWGQAMLTGFAQAAANNLHEFDDQIPDQI